MEYTERDKQFWNNYKYWMKDAYAIEGYLIPRVRAQLEVAKGSIKKRLEKDLERLEQRLELVMNRIKEGTE